MSPHRAKLLLDALLFRSYKTPKDHFDFIIQGDVMKKLFTRIMIFACGVSLSSAVSSAPTV